MIYFCHGCNKTMFHSHCFECVTESPQEVIPLDASYYSDFHYKSKGLVKDLFGKKKEQAQLNALLENVLSKYNDLLNPYFYNFAHVILNERDVHNDTTSNQVIEDSYSPIELFQEVLIRKGFDELKGWPELLYKLLDTTLFSSLYHGFKKEVERHIGSDLENSLRSWIDETGTDFRSNISLFLYFLWEKKANFEHVSFNEEAVNNRSLQLVDDDTISLILIRAERIYKDILVGRLDYKLANFDPDKYVTIYSVDGMDGFEFEKFLTVLFQTLGYDVTETKKTGDQGADLFVEKFGKKIVIQAKNYSGSVGNSAVQQVLAAKTFYGCDEAMVITNSYFTRSANELAEASSVKLIDRKALIKYLDDYNQQLIESENVDKVLSH